MRNLKKTMAMLLSLVMVGTAFAGCGDDKDSSAATTTTGDGGVTTTSAPAEGVTVEPDTGKVLTIYCWNDEFKTRFEKFYTVPEGITVNWVITPSEGNQYQNKLDSDLMNPTSEPIDIFLMEADYAKKYVNSNFSLDVTSIGITAADTANMYDYTKEACTDASGALKGLSWQGCPGLFIYRRSIATAVFGTDDPTEIQAKVADMATFEATAAELKAAGYYMLGSYDDSYRVYSNNVSAPWVDENKKIVIDDKLMEWVDDMKEFTDNGYNQKDALWGETWGTGFTPTGTVFGYFGPGWFIDFCMGDTTVGDWAACEGPAAYTWGGTWIAAANGTDNPNLVADVMKQLTCNQETLLSIVDEYGDFVNNQPAMDEVAVSDYANTMLGGQNHIALFAASASNASLANISAYDQGLNEKFQLAMHDYFAGTVTKDEAIENFYTIVLALYPALSR
ncbi:MAG: carbohydrate ABC transporter substrate-binding protein [Oscillospiraceae bacterium]|jgi:hypothetical protein